MEEAKNQAADHWEYVKGLLASYSVSESAMQAAEYQYKSAFIHGWKHGVEYTHYTEAGR